MAEQNKAYRIRQATIEDLDRITDLESRCFSKADAATRENFKGRLEVFPNHFWLLEVDGVLVSLVNGMVTNHSILEDEMYADSSRHDENGDWQMIFGVETHPDYRRQGYAEILLNYVIEETRKQKRKGLVLTCKEHMVHYYAKFGFVNEAFDHWIELGSGCCKEKESTVSGSGRTGERGGRSESKLMWILSINGNY